MNLIRIETPKMFTAIRETLSNGKSWYSYDKSCMQYCVECGQVFLARFGFISGMGWQKWRGETFYCPDCGKMHNLNYLTIRNDRTDREYDWLPYSMTLRLDEFKNHLVLSVQAECIKFSEDGTEVSCNKLKETFRFDVKNQTVTYQRGMAESIEVGNPYTSPELLRNSLLRFVNPESTMWQKQKGEVAELLKELRTSLSTKIKEQKGINLSSFFVQSGRRYGLLLLPIVNIAFRLACPDAANLELTEGRGDFETLNALLTKSRNMPCADSEDRLNSVMVLTRKGLSTPQAIARAYGLPDTKGVRKLLTKANVLLIGKAKSAFDMIGDYKYSLYVAKSMLRNPELWMPENAVSFITEVRKRFGAKTAVKLIIHYPTFFVDDTVQTYFKLTAENQEAFWLAKPTAEQMHDWLVAKWNEQKTSNYNLNVPEAIIRRLEMQRETINFFVPTTAWQLRDAGKELHNCVGTYAEGVLRGGQRVVLVSDDKGKLKICLEITGNEIRQAKLVNNKPVSQDAALNAEVLKWAEGAKLTINTQDIQVQGIFKAEAV